MHAQLNMNKPISPHSSKAQTQTPADASSTYFLYVFRTLKFCNIAQTHFLAPSFFFFVVLFTWKNRLWWGFLSLLFGVLCLPCVFWLLWMRAIYKRLKVVKCSLSLISLFSNSIIFYVVFVCRCSYLSWLGLCHSHFSPTLIYNA